MKALKFSAIAAILLAFPATAQAGDSKPGMRHPGAGMHHMGKHGVGGVRNWGPKHNGRWVGGYRAPGGWGGYRRPFVGYVLPRYWVQPSFYLGNYTSYGFAQPSYGYGWSRYYDDAVLTDRYGRVQDYVPGVNWDRYDAYQDGGNYGGGNYGYAEDYRDSYGYADGGYRDDRRYDDRKRGVSGAGAAVIGGVLGAGVGGLVTKKGSHTEGAIIGGVLGAATGAAVASSSNKKRKRYAERYDDYRGQPVYQGGYGQGGYGSGSMPYDYGSVTGSDQSASGGQWAGTWTGSYNGGPTQVWSGQYQGDYDGVSGGTTTMAQPHWGAQHGSYPAPMPQPSYHHQGGTMSHHGGVIHTGPGITTVTVQSQPVVTTTTTEIIEEVVYTTPVRKRYAPKRVVRAKPKPRCVCKVVYR